MGETGWRDSVRRFTTEAVSTGLGRSVECLRHGQHSVLFVGMRECDILSVLWPNDDVVHLIHVMKS